MKVYLMRHCKVNFNWDNFYNSRGFDEACKVYDSNPIVDQIGSLDFQYENIYVSMLSRTLATAKVLGIQKGVHKVDLLNEVPISSFMDTTFRLPTFIWLILGRVQWYFNCKRQQETRLQTLQRIIDFINLLEAEKKTCLVIGHGFYFSQLEKQLKLKNYRGKSRTFFKNGEVSEFWKV